MCFALSILGLVVFFSYRSLAQISLSKNFYFASAESVNGSSNSLLYGIMFDAGSTGSRIHVFTFKEVPDGSLALLDEYFDWCKPGLSAYADNPAKGAESINTLLQKAKRLIPRYKWKTTPVALKATAGLRLLPPKAADQLLKEVTAVLESSEFLAGPKSVSIMDGQDEGIYAWMTVNFLEGGITDHSKSLYGTLDLGGGSVQITFTPQEQTINSAPEGFVRHTTIFKHRHTLYSHSYLGLGLMAARMAILNHGPRVHSYNKNARYSPCLPNGFKGKFKFQSKVFDVSGVSTSGYEQCVEIAKKIVTQVQKADEVATLDFHIFSYFYDRAVEIGLIDRKQGGQVFVKDFTSGAKRACAGEVEKARNFLCLDTVFIKTLLTDGFGLKEDKVVTMRKKINKVEVSWALGATLDLFDTSDE